MWHSVWFFRSRAEDRFDRSLNSHKIMDSASEVPWLSFFSRWWNTFLTPVVGWANHKFYSHFYNSVETFLFGSTGRSSFIVCFKIFATKKQKGSRAACNCSNNNLTNAVIFLFLFMRSLQLHIITYLYCEP